MKLDGCYSLPLDMDTGYPDFGRHLNNTGRPMIYSCSWPVYQIYAGISVSMNHFPNQIYEDIHEITYRWEIFEISI